MKGIVTAGGRSAGFPLFLASATEQVLATGVRSGLGLIDDSALHRVYSPQEPTLVLQLASSTPPPQVPDVKLRLVKQAMMGVHLAAAAEAMSLGAAVGLDTTKLFEIISTAAGTSHMFVAYGKQMLEGVYTETKTVDAVIAELVSSLAILPPLPHSWVSLTCRSPL
jgi:3-hydroxyisobutyrate dehydrogenase